MVLLLMAVLMTDSKYDKKAETAWRTAREESMRAEDSWLNLAGLYWLKEGENTFGAGEDRDIVLPPHTTVPKTGSFFVKGKEVTYKMSRGQRAVIGDKTANEGILEVNQTLAHNNLRFVLMERGGKLVIRLRDLRTKTFRKFENLNFFAPRRKYFVKATFEPYEEPEKITVGTVINTEVEYWVPGVIKFKLDGQDLTLVPTLANLEDERFWIMLKDQTSGKSTYGAGRFLYASRPDENNKMILNFNRIYNMPCSYTPYSTCPLPPSDNWLPVSLEAGERKYHEQDSM
ncbi:MAG: DUF1684 domain-containing protein [Acidobacteriota bacterium]|nr:DUF1684 domain-containing protein [Acidobacteriota bacterium]